MTHNLHLVQSTEIPRSLGDEMKSNTVFKDSRGCHITKLSGATEKQGRKEKWVEKEEKAFSNAGNCFNSLPAPPQPL